MLRHPQKVSAFVGPNTVGPWLKFDPTAVRLCDQRLELVLERLRAFLHET
ncbi:hypothetical protein [Rhodococcus sp. 3A]|nr:hypothetical protein [Rhodococcus sp. 3A]MBC2897304.1 hypothetical protein [Rhodococcus sp. 4CII]